MNNNLAPIVLFVYNRPWHTEQTLNALMQNKQASESTLYIYCDGVKENATDEQIQQIIDVRNVIRAKKWCKEVYIIESELNIGLANSIIRGVFEVLSKHAKVIVLEDDIVTSRYFLKYMNDALNMYENEDDVISISGYIYPIKARLPNTFFIKGADCWGWATWKRGWDLFEPNGQKLLLEIEEKNLTHIFDFDDSYSYTKMLMDQIEGRNDSWAVRWYASAFLKNKLTLYPGYSFVSNIGFDGSGIHCVANDFHSTELKVNKMALTKNPTVENIAAKRKIIHYFKYKNDNLISIMYCKVRKNIMLVLRSINGKRS